MSTTKRINQCIEEIILDIKRRGLGDPWNDIDPETRSEIKQSWYNSIEECIIYCQKISNAEDLEEYSLKNISYSSFDNDYRCAC